MAGSGVGMGGIVGMVVAGVGPAGDPVGPAATPPVCVGARAALGLMTEANWIIAVSAAAPNITRTIVLTVRSAGRHSVRCSASKNSRKISRPIRRRVHAIPTRKTRSGFTGECET